MSAASRNDLGVPKVPRGLRVLPSSSTSPQMGGTRTELADLQQEAARIERWWTEPRWKHTKRIYSGK
jgi:hypothetical protein